MKKRNINSDILPPIREIFDALQFSAEKHKFQKRKGAPGIPYINHPIGVATLLLHKIDNPENELIIAALLHDTIEDTSATQAEIEIKFGSKVFGIVQEVTDDMSLSSSERKRQQIVNAKSLSFNARCIKIADKTCNINDILCTRIKWLRLRKIAYIRWAIEVVSEIRDTHPELIDAFDSIVRKSEELLDVRFS
jgi:guanosine-3',5'-bis(diphosphate) 3'-pyrophosphohydrolase